MKMTEKVFLFFGAVWQLCFFNVIKCPLYKCIHLSKLKEMPDISTFIHLPQVKKETLIRDHLLIPQVLIFFCPRK